MKMDERGNRGAGREIWRVREGGGMGGVGGLCDEGVNRKSD